MNFCIIYLASPRSHHIFNDPNQESRLELLNGSLNITRKLFPTTDIFVFHEDLEDGDIPDFAELIQVDFSGKEDIVNPKLRRPYGYLMMCRFFSGIVQQHPKLQPYTHYMRLDDDSYFTEPYLTEDYVKTHLLKHDYVYRSVFSDIQDQKTLFDFTLNFLRKEGYASHIPTLLKELERKYIVRNGEYTGIAPYNNFHIASRRLWDNPMVQRYIQTLDESNGILKLGWMDANIHSMIIYILTLFIGMKIHHESSFGYRHNRHVSRMDSMAVDYIESLPFGASKRIILDTNSRNDVLGDQPNVSLALEELPINNSTSAGL